MVDRFARLLQRHRGKASVNALARLAELDPAGIFRLESGATRPLRGTVLALAGALRLDDVETDILLAGGGHCPQILADLGDDSLREVIVMLYEALADGELVRDVSQETLPEAARRAG